MIDLNGIYETIGRFRQPMRKLLHMDPATGHESLKSLSIRFWYENLRRRTGLTTAYSLEHFFEPSSFIRGESDSISSYRNKWIRYEDGIHRPQPTLVRKIEEKCPGSARDLDHPLWRVLDLSDQKVLKGDSFLRTLAPSVQAAMFSPDDDAPLIQSARLPITFVLLNRLERKANLDALACLVWILRQSVQDGAVHTNRVCYALHHVMIMMAMDLHVMKVAHPLLQILIDQILSLAMPVHHRVVLSAEEYVEASATLNTLVYRTRRCAGKSLPWSTRTRVMAKLLDVTSGFDIFFAMGRPFQHDLVAPTFSEALFERGAHDQREFQWGWSCLRRGRRGSYTELLQLHEEARACSASTSAE